MFWEWVRGVTECSWTYHEDWSRPGSSCLHQAEQLIHPTLLVLVQWKAWLSGSLESPLCVFSRCGWPHWRADVHWWWVCNHFPGVTSWQARVASMFCFLIAVPLSTHRRGLQLQLGRQRRSVRPLWRADPELLTVSWCHSIYNTICHCTKLYSFHELPLALMILFFTFSPLLHCHFSYTKICHPRSRLTLKWKWTLVHLQEVLFTETASFPLPKYEESYKVCSNVEPEVTATAATWLFFFVTFFLHFFY